MDTYRFVIVVGQLTSALTGDADVASFSGIAYLELLTVN